MGFLTLIAFVVSGVMTWDYCKYRRDPMPSSLFNLVIIFTLTAAMVVINFYLWKTTGSPFTVRDLVFIQWSHHVAL